MTDYSCAVEGCLRARDARGLCQAHYMRWRRYGDPLGGSDRMGSEHVVCACAEALEPDGLRVCQRCQRPVLALILARRAQ